MVDVGFYCDIFANSHATLLVFIVLIVRRLIIYLFSVVVILSLIVFLKKWFEIWIFETISDYGDLIYVNTKLNK